MGHRECVAAIVGLVMVYWVWENTSGNQNSGSRRGQDSESLRYENTRLGQIVFEKDQQVFQVVKNLKETESSLTACWADLSAKNDKVIDLEKALTELSNNQKVQQEAGQKSTQDLNEEIRKCKEALLNSNKKLGETKEELQSERKKCIKQSVTNKTAEPQNDRTNYFIILILVAIVLKGYFG